ncbi:PREDICTED: uncharacterized protein LOC107083559 [Cyprinodon variegatus]|uniref:uncharacterized protein LOC107083559 n=1 Tax=Cyprinodon variegatus TaxID=28743 RepID=UPI0007425522|nr:PREDICTED: uncharacterized protein LOC107083559 [Cyprinodon variegatus]
MISLILAALLLTATGSVQTTEKSSDGEVGPCDPPPSSPKNQCEVHTCDHVSKEFRSSDVTHWLVNTSEHTVLFNVYGLSDKTNLTILSEYLKNAVACTYSNNITNSSGVVKQSNGQFTDLLKCFLNILKNHLLLFLIIFGVGILTGSLVSTFIICLAIKCHRKKKTYSAEELELVTTDIDPQVHDDEVLDLRDDGIQNQEPVEFGDDSAENLIDSEMSPKESEYSDIDFSAIKGKIPMDEKEEENTRETEYAEIKRVEMEEPQDNNEIDCEIWEGNNEEVEIEHQEEVKQDMLAEQVIEDEPPASIYEN